MQGKLRVRGDLPTIVRYVQAANELVRLTGLIDTEFPDEAVDARRRVRAPKESCEVAERPEPAIEEPGDAIVRVTRAGICGSDLHFFHGKAPIDPGATMGHEAVGIVERVGDGVTTVRPGDRVVDVVPHRVRRVLVLSLGADAVCARTTGSSAAARSAATCRARRRRPCGSRSPT